LNKPSRAERRDKPPHNRGEQLAGRALAVVERRRHGSVLHQTTMGDPGRAPRSPGVRNCMRGVAPVPGRRSDRKPRSALATTFYGPDPHPSKDEFLSRACGQATAL
jgi:hypothetical protein